MHLIDADSANVGLAITSQELRDLYHIAMTANLVFDEMDTVPYDATAESIGMIAAFLEKSVETEPGEPDRLALTRLQMNALASTVYTLDISFYPPDGNPFDLTQDLITGYARQILSLQEKILDCAKAGSV